MAIKTVCAICGRPIVDEDGGRFVPLCSEECEERYANPEPCHDENGEYRAGYAYASGYED